MPSLLHEMLVEVFRNRPRLACELLELCAGIRLGADTVEPGPTDVSQIAPTEYRADNVVMLRNDSGIATGAIIIECQLAPDPEKRYTWPVYIATARARLECPATLLVVVRDLAVARWARQPIDTGHPGFVLTPIVICLAGLPRLSTIPVEQRTPELVLLCALGHPEIEEASAALATLDTIDDERSALYWDVLLAHLPTLTRQLLESGMQGYKYQSEFARKYYGQGLDKGREEGRDGMQGAALELIAAKLGAIPADLADRVRGMRDLGALARVLVALAQARDEAAIRAAIDAI